MFYHPSPDAHAGFSRHDNPYSDSFSPAYRQGYEQLTEITENFFS